VLDEKGKEKIKKLCDFAPLHNKSQLNAINQVSEDFPKAKGYAVFDTSFHQTIPDYAYLYPIPEQYYKGLLIRKYGFHGTSHKYVAQEAAKLMQKSFSELKIISLHLGNGYEKK